MLSMILFACADGSTAGSFGPSVSAVTVVSLSPGVCPAHAGTSAKTRVSWTIGNGDPALYTIMVYENGVLWHSSTTDTSHDKTFFGYVEDGEFSTYVSALTYRVDLLRNSDSVVVASSSSDTWNQLYGTCT